MYSNGIAILGAGLFAREAYLPALVALGESAPPLRAIYSRSEKTARRFSDAAIEVLPKNKTPAIYHDGDQYQDTLGALLSRHDITAVIIALPISFQPAIILRSLAAGKHVLSEKPVAPNVKQGLELIKAYNSKYKKKGLIWRVAENYEAEPGYQAAGAAIAAGKIGKVLFFKTVVCHSVDKESKWYKTPWRTIPDHQGGFVLDGGVHIISALQVMLPHPLTHLSGFSSLAQAHLKPQDTINAVARAGSLYHGIVEITFGSPTRSHPTSDGFFITGTHGWLSVNQPIDIEGTGVPILRVTIKTVVKTDGKPDEEKEEIIEVPVSGVRSELESFFRVISGRDDGSGLGDPLDALRSVAFIEAVLNSGGNMVDLLQLVPTSL